jgi:L-fuconolactonase
MRIVDCHVHVSDCWYEPVETLLYDMDQNGVENAVLVQMQGQTDNNYLFQCVRRYPGKFAPVVIVDTYTPTACDDLKQMAEEGASGVRLHLKQLEGASGVRLRPFPNSPNGDPLAIWKTAAQLGLAVDCAGSSLLFGSEEFSRMVQALPDTTIVVEHLGAHGIPDNSDAERAARLRALELAKFPNVYLKIGGLGEICRRAQPLKGPFPFDEPIPPLLDMAYKAFGPRRIMWGSNFPLVLGKEGYRNALRLPMQQFEPKSEGERDLMFGQVALSVFPVRG